MSHTLPGNAALATGFPLHFYPGLRRQGHDASAFDFGFAVRRCEAGKFGQMVRSQFPKRDTDTWECYVCGWAPVPDEADYVADLFRMPVEPTELHSHAAVARSVEPMGSPIVGRVFGEALAEPAGSFL